MLDSGEFSEEFEVNRPVVAWAVLALRFLALPAARSREFRLARVFPVTGFFCLYIRHRSVECCVNWAGVPVGIARRKQLFVSFFVCLFLYLLRIIAHFCSAMRRAEIVPTHTLKARSPLGALLICC